MTTDPLFPPTEPYHSGYLEVSPVHQIYYEECGNPHGKPVLVLHGGPGSGCNPGQRRFFDPTHYRIVLFDQRGCGRSLPAGCVDDNSIQALANDMELLREHLGISRWLVFGGSWGSTLALFYASLHAEKITGLLLRGIFLTRPSEIRWFLYEVGRIFPEAWVRFVEPLSTNEITDILSAYHQRIFNAPENEQLTAAQSWSVFENAIMYLSPPATSAASSNNSAMIARLRVHLHYLIHDCFLADSPLLAQVEKFRRIPAIIIHGRYDMVCPIQTAYELHQAWSEADFRVVPVSGHSASEPGIAAALVSATEQFKSLA
ncbi:MAG: prolyl aminopeptidase [Methylophilales bacterium]|nr:prolyl aminopeptidase [Methylophilales bacterium]